MKSCLVLRSPDRADQRLSRRHPAQRFWFERLDEADALHVRHRRAALSSVSLEPDVKIVESGADGLAARDPVPDFVLD